LAAGGFELLLVIEVNQLSQPALTPHDFVHIERPFNGNVGHLGHCCVMNFTEGT
jgi:hypothetical protein